MIDFDVEILEFFAVEYVIEEEMAVEIKCVYELDFYIEDLYMVVVLVVYKKY